MNKHNGGFTLLELTAGLAVLGLLVLSVLQVVSRFTDMSSRLGETTRRRHTRAVLARLLWEDLNHRPVNDPKLEGEARRLERTTVSYETERMLRLDTRVRYEVRSGDGGQRLVRRWKWLDLHEDFQAKQTLLRARNIEFGYRGNTERWFSTAQEARPVRAVRLEWGEERQVVVPVLPVSHRNGGDTPGS